MNLKISGHFVDYKNDFIGTIIVKKGIITEIIKDNVFEINIDKIIFPLIIEDNAFEINIDRNKIIFPGMIDIHVHAREDESQEQNYKEDYNTCQAAAINGGVVCIAVMPNTQKPLVTYEQLEWHQQRCKNLDVIVCNYVGIGPATKPLSKNETIFRER